jgi:dinuclear metal center YbgI/SA1388 family protein
MERQRLLAYINDYLKITDFNDLGPNGLQVAGSGEIKKIITAVSASVALFRKAIELKADTLIVHHGIIWNFERPLYIGGYRERLRLLLGHNLNLLAYHLPLDAHPEIGNNAQLANRLGLHSVQPFGDYKGNYVGVRGEVTPTESENFFGRIEHLLERKPLVFPYGPEKISRVGIISGGAQKELNQAVAAGLDVFITGEVSEHTMYYAQEEQIHFVAAGHYATERYGVQALGDLIRKKFSIDVAFVDIENPV